MLSFFSNQENSSIQVIRRSDPNACGGTDETLDTGAPKTIRSEEMTLFDVNSVLMGGADPAPLVDGEALGYISAFAAPSGEGTFLFLARMQDPRRDEDARVGWKLVRENVFSRLVQLVGEHDLAAYNGHRAFTHGLPMNFGGSIRIRYADGEAIDVTDNRAPVLSVRTGAAIAEVFLRAMEGEAVPLPSPDDLRAIRFDEECADGSYTHAVLTLLPDGAGTNAKQQHFAEDPTVFETEKPVDAETVAAIRRKIGSTGLLAWTGLPDDGSKSRKSDQKRLTFVFGNGREITVRDGRLTPGPLHGGFFFIELEMTIKH